MNERVFVIEDDNNIQEVIKIALTSVNYIVETFDNAIDAIEAINSNPPALAIFDIMLPNMSGIEAIEEIRKTNQDLPILILSAKDSEIDKVNGLNSGGDDYLTKPFGILELQARVRSLLRRTTKNDVVSSKHLVVDKKTRIVKVDNKVIDLTKKEYQLLTYLMDRHSRIVEREELLNNIWGYDFMGESRALDVHIRALRSKLDNDTHRYIKTIRGVGYRFNEDGEDNE